MCGIIFLVYDICQSFNFLAQLCPVPTGRGFTKPLKQTNDAMRRCMVSSLQGGDRSDDEDFFSDVQSDTSAFKMIWNREDVWLCLAPFWRLFLVDGTHLGNALCLGSTSDESVNRPCCSCLECSRKLTGSSDSTTCHTLFNMQPYVNDSMI